MNKDIVAIILAAGKGLRMKSQIPKVLHPICSRPMIGYVLDLVKELKINRVITVLGYKHEEVRGFLDAQTEVVVQKKLIGTADALKTALGNLKNFKGALLVLYGDTPLLKKETINKLLKYHFDNNLDATLLTGHLDKPTGYGRILRDKYLSICGIVEEKDADDFQKDIKEINTGIICFNKDRLMQALKCVKPNNRKREYYLTDTIKLIYKSGGLIDSVQISDTNEAMGINSRLELAQANSIMQRRINEKFMLGGITIIDPGSTFISYGTKIGQDTVIYPFTVIEKDVKIGRCCFLGPFIHLREGTNIKDDIVLGNFLEIVRSNIGPKTMAKHFCYIGDTKIGKRVNIGAGAVTANFDGKGKNRTVIKDDAFIGSDTVLVAPVEIGKAAKTGAGAVVIKDTRDKSTVVGVPAKPLKEAK
ncbi:MAG: NTP transferase domain-containing protein [Candidatus Omnitrophota bacterium]|nr:NTP transferase domain-containing protein [Candidatus Omnitrophota bacterium]